MVYYALKFDFIIFLYYYFINPVIMQNLTKLEITVADITGNYMTWSVSVKMDLRGNGLLETINKLKTMSYEKKEKDMMFLRNYIHDGLNDKYIMKEDHVDILAMFKREV